MKPSGLKIATTLRLALATLMLMLLVAGTLFWVQSDRMFRYAKGLYEHPMMVSRAVGVMEVDVMAIHHAMKELAKDPGDAALAKSLQGIAIHERNMDEQFDLVSERYLGPRADLYGLRDMLIKWKAAREEALRLWRAGDTTGALAMTNTGGGVELQAESVLSQLRGINAFAIEKADQFYQSAGSQHASTALRLAVIIPLAMIFCLTIAWGLLTLIKTPLKDLTAAMEGFRKGNLGTRCQSLSTNEFGLLADSFNEMADAIETQTRIDHNVAVLAEIALNHEEIHLFCREILVGLLQHTGSQVGAIYFLNEEKTAFVHFESIGLSASKRAAFSATLVEGEFGAALATRRIQHIKEIPADTNLALLAVSGEYCPREILTIPLVSENSVTALISLASLQAYDDASVRFVNEIWSVLSARVNGMLSFEKSKMLAARLELQNQELELQKRELANQTDELSTQNIELEMQKQQLDEANRLKSAFLSNMSHELRTPLNSVIALSGVLNRRLAKVIPDEEYSYLEVIERNGKNLLSLINDILDLSRIEAGRETLRLSNFSVREWVADTVEMLQPQAVEKNIRLTSHVSDELPRIVSDPDKCVHILQNLVGNAVKFTDEGSVEISARPLAGGIEVVVSDTGIGIAQDQLPHIFDEFRQADGSNSRRYGGTGLGLAIAKKYAHLVGGHISVKSEVGKGSAFSLWLPLSVDSANPGQIHTADSSFIGRTHHDAAAATLGHGQKILLVEDNEPAIVQLTDILGSHGYDVQSVRNGLEALSLIERNPPDAMILDLMMPGIDGFQVLQAVRNHERSLRLPVLILTAKQITCEELSTLKGNHIFQLIQKGDINKEGLLSAVARMVASPPPMAHAAIRRRPSRPGKPLILVVEDDSDNLRTIHALLGDYFQVIEARDGQTGVDLARQHQPDLILTDIALPVMDGFGVIAAIRQDDLISDIPVIAVTASAMTGNREEIIAKGFDAYVSKPIDHLLLQDTLRQFLTRDST